MTTAQPEHVSVLPNSRATATADKTERLDAAIRLVLVDDDDDFREAAAIELGHLGFEVASLADGISLFRYFEQGKSADIIILDWKLPTYDGIDVLPQLRRHGIQVPVVFLTGFSGTAHEREALEHGALDFVDKSRGIDILAKRIRLIVGATKHPAELPINDAIRCGRLVLRPKASRACWDDIDVMLTVTEFNIVQCLVTSASEYVTYRSIYDCVHRIGFMGGCGDDGYRTNVRSSIKRIRNKFRAIDAAFSQIENFPAFGYRWRGAPARAA